MRNGQLKAAYNLQISTNKQFILHYSIHPNPTDTKTLESHLKGFEESYHKVPKELVADAGYGSEENYNLLKNKKIKPYVKYNYFRKDQKSGQITTSQNNPKLAKIRERLLNFSIPKKASNSENSDVTMLNLFLQSSNTTKTLNALCFEEKPRSR